MTRRCPVRAGALAHPDLPALSFSGRRWTYAALDAEVGRWTAALRARGVGPGERVVVLAGSVPEVVHLFWALGRLGAVMVPLNARLTAGELAPLVLQASARLALALAPLGERLPGAEPLEALAEAARACGPETEAPAPDDDAPRVVLFTSGTTGVPKGAVLTEGNFRASCRASAANLGAHPHPVWLGTLPLFHVGGLAMLTRTHLGGGHLVLHERFDEAAVNHALDTEAISHASFVPTTLGRVLDARHDRPVPATFRFALIGGGPVPPALLARAHASGLRALQTYGLTEACSQVTTERPDEADGSTAGRALPGLALRVVDADGRERGPGEEGDLEVRGPTVMAGYLGRPDATRETLRPDGWLRTRDVGVLDARGRLTVLSRRTDLIVRGGENVYPAELEAVLATHPDVQEAAVLGMPHETWGQVPVAALVLRPGRPLPADLAGWCRARLARFKVPERFVTLDALPRNAMGKVDRTALRSAISRGPSPAGQTP